MVDRLIAVQPTCRQLGGGGEGADRESEEMAGFWLAAVCGIVGVTGSH